MLEILLLTIVGEQRTFLRKIGQWGCRKFRCWHMLISLIETNL